MGEMKIKTIKDDFDHYSVLMSVYKNDNPKYLKQAIESMLDQTILPEQYVIVIDGPVPEKIDRVIQYYKKAFPALFTIVPLEKNGGLGNALNNGIEVCRNEFIARMDADDISKTERCEKQLAAFKGNPNLDIVGAQIDEFIGDINNVVSRRLVPLTNDEIVQFSRRRSPFNHPTVMYRKSTLKKVGGYVAYGRKEDLDLFVRMMHSGCQAANLPESLLWYRTGSDNLKRRKTWINCKENIQIMWKYYLKGYCKTTDIVYVIVGQMAMYLLPEKIAKIAVDKFLREKHEDSTHRKDQ